MESPHDNVPESNVRDMTPEEEDSIDRYNTPGAANRKVPPGLTPAGQYEITDPHERLVEDVMELTAGLFRSQTGKAPDAKYLATMRNTYARLDDNRLRIETEKLTKELTLAGKK